MRRALSILLLALAASLVAAALASSAGAEGLSDDSGAEWRLEQPAPPAPPTGVEGATAPVGLGRIGDIAFWAPNRGALTTAGNGSTVPAGVWAYNGQTWHEISIVCGASDGRIAWAGPNEFWTISDGRPGQAPESNGDLPPLEDNTLCHFAVGPSGKLEVVGSYATLGFQSTSYQPMDAATCLSPSNCWFGGAALTEPQVGAFQLHWNGKTITTEPYLPEGHPIGDMANFEGRIYESVTLSPTDRVIKHTLEPPALHVLDPEASSTSFEPVLGMPLYGSGEFSSALDFLRLSSDSNSIWAAAGPSLSFPEKSVPAGVTILRYSKRHYSTSSHEYEEEEVPSWQQVVGPETEPTGLSAFPDTVIDSVAAEPGTDSAWLSLTTVEEAQDGASPVAPAAIARISGDGTISDELDLPETGSGYGPKGDAERIVCPAVHDCWVTTSRGWLFHLSTAAERASPQVDGDAVFSGQLITERPIDESVPQQESDVVPEDTSGLVEAAPAPELLKQKAVKPLARVQLPLLSNVRSRLRSGTTLDVSFHLSVKARVKLIAKRHSSIVAKTATVTFKAGNHDLQVRLNIHSWPTKLDLQTHALAPLKTVSTLESGTETVSTSAAFPNLGGLLSGSSWPSLGGSGRLP